MINSMTITASDFEWTHPLNVVLLALMLVLLIVQCVWLFAKHRHSGRFVLRLTLNLLLWVSLLAWIVDPAISMGRRFTKGLLIADNVPSEVVRHLKDSLKNSEVITRDLLSNADVDTLVIAGQQFDPGLFAALRQHVNPPHLQWEPYFEKDHMQQLRWKGSVRKGEMQRVEGMIDVSGKRMLSVRFGNEVLDSVLLSPGVNHFRLAFPAFSEGRTAVTLHTNSGSTDTLRYFSLPAEKLTIRFLLGNPDFETRNLAAWLGKQGHSVLYDAVLSKNISSQLNINQAKDPDLIVTNPQNAAHAAVRQAIAQGRGVLFLGLTDVPGDVKRINDALRTRFQPIRISNEESVPVSPSLSALPFRWNVQGFHSHALHYPVQSERTSGKVTVSLLNETFPMQLSGDSLGYAKVWHETLAWARPTSAPVVAWDAPVWSDVPVRLQGNNVKSWDSRVQIGRDTVFTEQSPLNAQSVSAIFLPRESGWLSLHDSLGTALFVEDNTMLSEAARMRHFIQTSRYAETSRASTRVPARRKVPSWGWFVCVMVLMSALWIERKL